MNSSMLLLLLLLLLSRFSRVQLSVTPWTAVYQAPLSIGFSRQEYWSGLPLPSLQEMHTASRNGKRQMLYHLYVESKTHNKLVNITTKKSRLIDTKNKIVVTSGRAHNRGWGVGGTINWE